MAKWILGTSGDDELVSVLLQRGDTLHGRAGDDTLEGDAVREHGRATLAGGLGDDLLIVNDEEGQRFGGFTWFGGAGTDTLRIDGELGDRTFIHGARGVEVLIAGFGHDTIVGTDRAETIQGGDWADRFAGRGGDDLLITQAFASGGNGDDTLMGDTYTGKGGAGADTFVLLYRAHLLDFTPGEDQVEMVGFGPWADFEDLSFRERGRTLDVSVGGVTMLTMLNVDAPEITAGDFIFT